MTDVDDLVLRLIDVADELDEISDELDESTLARNVVGTICGQQADLVLELAHELETDPHGVTHGTP